MSAGQSPDLGVSERLFSPISFPRFRDAGSKWAADRSGMSRSRREGRSASPSPKTIHAFLAVLFAGALITSGTAAGKPLGSPRWLQLGRTPAVSITSGPANVTTSSTATFTFEAAGSTMCRLDAGARRQCSSPATYSSLSNGTHVFTVDATLRNSRRAPPRAGRLQRRKPPHQHQHQHQHQHPPQHQHQPPAPAPAPAPAPSPSPSTSTRTRTSTDTCTVCCRAYSSLELHRSRRRSRGLDLGRLDLSSPGLEPGHVLVRALES